MTLDHFVSQLEGVRRTARGVMARCPAHDDKSPSLSVAAGERGILIRCWAGCELSAITHALDLHVSDLFFDAGLAPQQQHIHRQERDRQRAEREKERHREGLRIDAEREAESLIVSARNLDISDWSDKRLHRELNRLANAYAFTEGGAIHGD